MKFLRKFNEHTSYEAELNSVGVDISLPNVSYCEDVKDVHYTPYNLVRFYVGNITGTTPQTVKIYTDLITSVDVEVSKGNKWYTYVIPKDKGLYNIEGDSVKKVVVKADIDTNGNTIIPTSTVEASFKGSKILSNTYNMFNGCSNLTSLDLRNFNTSKVTSMNGMFYGCSNLTSLDLSSFNTSNVTDMNNMFNNCSGLTSLDLRNFNTSNVTRMNFMFGGCSGLTSLDLSSFDTSNVTEMISMFYECSSLSSLTLSNFDTSKVTRMGGMFDGCSNLISLDLRNFNISNVSAMSNMFDGCSGLTSLDLSGWNMSKVTSMYGMFDGCSKSLNIRMVGCTKDTIDKIKAQLTNVGISLDNITT